MDLILFADDPRCILKRSRFPFIPERKAPAVTTEAFAAWPEHMRREFAALVTEAGMSDRAVKRATGIGPVALSRARATSRRFALHFNLSQEIDEAVIRQRAREKRHREKSRRHEADYRRRKREQKERGDA